ncbi:MAG: Ribosomal RNA small subunit methyltransferase H [Sporanaerobacter sp.]|uniref:class I SAM-dependent methyltransferase n=1 Tax=Sporanaerobacter sp. TaxID=2010183 RepID=UPI003A100B6F
MSYKYFMNALEIARSIMNKIISFGDTVIDCTVGNGNDTLYLAKLVGSKGKVYGFDIQNKALSLTQEKLTREGLNDRVKLIHDGHEKLFKYIDEEVKFAIFNLGYLPGGDHSIVTRPDTTILGIQNCIKILSKNGIILIICYTGHEGGLEEKNELEKYFSVINQKECNVLKFQFINQINSPPVLYGIEKL